MCRARALLERQESLRHYRFVVEGLCVHRPSELELERFRGLIAHEANSAQCVAADVECCTAVDCGRELGEGEGDKVGLVGGSSALRNNISISHQDICLFGRFFLSPLNTLRIRENFKYLIFLFLIPQVDISFFCFLFLR